ncbi:sporulation protein RMD5 [Magnaporthiopsis poae ATCC 64411]|uniref:GID complex catalytic subunit 2 n=1 Tax=Magnaporthiopsis poae (strain ATCC 64411 / 73-15) TaxID=644358 RepID=A0A0C4DT28_MAGP6|nr:sporulation protein RMD5 [Magnaporthiopsis poae ATCC 64411]
MADKPKPVDAMPQLHKDIQALAGKARLTEAVADIDDLIQKLTEARQSVAAARDPHTATLALTKLQNPVKEVFDRVNGDLRNVSKVQRDLGKALDKALPVTNIPADHDAMDDQATLINRAIAMHLLREGQFSVARTFIAEARNASANQRSRAGDGDQNAEVGEDSSPDETDTAMESEADTRQTNDLAMSLQSQELQAKFENMYHILQALRRQDLGPAIDWSRSHSTELESRGSNLEFELCKLQYVHLFVTAGPRAAYEYGRLNMSRFHDRHLVEIQRLAGALVYAPNLPDSPYASLFDSPTAFLDAANSFTREFCSLLGLSAESPLYLAATAGAIALPRLVKYMNATKAHGAEWTTAHELAFETPLPHSFMYHSVFVCPVSKEQTTTSNPPMILPCGHVLARDSLKNLIKNGQRFKCPYCPAEGNIKDARPVIL